MKKPRILYIGDSVAHNAEFNNIEMVNRCRMRTMKAYSSVNDGRARWVKKNFADVAPLALKKTHEDDPYSHLVLSAPTVDITNIDTSKLTENDNIEVLHESVKVSCQNMFTTAQNALKTNPLLQKVVIMEHAPRFDTTAVDPLSIKPLLAKFANATLSQLWFTSPYKNRIQIGHHKLEYTNDNVEEHFLDSRKQRYDGVHMYSYAGKKAYTDSIAQIVKEVLSSSNLPKSSNHENCPQATFQNSQRNKTTSYSNIYTVPVSNKFATLGN